MNAGYGRGFSLFVCLFVSFFLSFFSFFFFFFFGMGPNGLGLISSWKVPLLVFGQYINN